MLTRNLDVPAGVFNQQHASVVDSDPPRSTDWCRPRVRGVV